MTNQPNPAQNSTLTTSILQLDIEWGRPQANINRAERLIAQAPDSDLYVLPEMWATGFATQPTDIAEVEQQSEALQWMRQTALSRHCALSGSLAIRTADGTFRNRHYFVDGRNPGADGNATEKHYDKHHLFRYGGEDKFYTPGEGHLIVSYCGFRLLLLTCFDLRFPVWSRYANNLKFDAIVVVANWPDSRQNAWQILTRARAIENQAFLIGCNRVGRDEYCHYRGLSTIVSPIGKSLAACPAYTESVASFSLNLETVEHLRTKFRVLEDRDIL